MEYLPEIGNAHIPSFRKVWEIFSPTSPNFTNLTSPPLEGLGEVLRHLLYIIHPVKQSVPTDSSKALAVWIT